VLPVSQPTTPALTSPFFIILGLPGVNVSHKKVRCKKEDEIKNKKWISGLC
jgi:hypothetical protein